MEDTSAMMPPTKEMILDALRDVHLPDGRDVVSAGLISGVALRGAKAGFLITIDPGARAQGEALRLACEQAVAAVAGVEAVTAVLTAQNAEPIPPSPQAGYAQPRERAVWNLTPVEHVRAVIAVGSGKGGVGKSTTAVNLALALARAGKRVGVLDADIYGPSLPRMLGLCTHGTPEIVDGKMVPPSAHGVRCMSMGFITGDAPAILRGPMVSKTLHQLLRSTAWGAPDAPLDILVIDMPPGTGDVHLSLVQQVPLAGALIVTTPQAVAVEDARKCLRMFEKTGVRVLGVVENMCGEMFGVGGGAALAQEAGVKLLGAIGLEAAIRKAGDAGAGFASAEYDAIAAGVMGALE